MTWTGFADGLAAVCFVLGAALVLIAAIGVVRFTDVLTRMHAAAKPQVLGLLLILVGLGLSLREPAVVGVLLLVGVFQLLTTPIASHMIGRAAFRAGQVDTEGLVVDDLSGVLFRERPGAGPGDPPGPLPH